MRHFLDIVLICGVSIGVASCKTTTSSTEAAAAATPRVAELVAKSSLFEWCKARNDVPEDFREVIRRFDLVIEKGLRDVSLIGIRFPRTVNERITREFPTPETRLEAARRYLTEANPERGLPALPFTNYQEARKGTVEQYCRLYENFIRRIDTFSYEDVSQDALVIFLSVPWMSSLNFEMSKISDASVLEANLPPRGNLEWLGLGNQRIGPGNHTKCSPKMLQDHVCKGLD